MEGLHRLYANTKPFYTRDLSLVSLEVLEPIPCGYQRTTVFQELNPLLLPSHLNRLGEFAETTNTHVLDMINIVMTLVSWVLLSRNTLISMSKKREM